MTDRGRPRQTKRCPACGTSDLAAFAENKSRRDKLQVYCRECMRYDHFLNKLKKFLTK